MGNALMDEISDGFSSLVWYNPVNPAATTPSDVSFFLHKLIQILESENNNFVIIFSSIFQQSLPAGTHKMIHFPTLFLTFIMNVVT